MENKIAKKEKTETETEKWFKNNIEEKFKITARVKQIILVIAQEEAKRLKYDYLEPEHIFLALIEEGEKNLAVQALLKMKIVLKTIKSEIEKRLFKNILTKTSDVPFSSNSKKVIDFAIEEAKSMGLNYIGTEHLLLGLIKEKESLTAKVLLEFGVTFEKTKIEINRLYKKE
ncbi:MAG: Clp protease N-terminal domain-containing protein [bacterium]